jgi:hypothetical protein
LDADVATIVEWSDGIAVGGNFTEADGNPANYVAYWDGASWDQIGDGFNGTVNALYVKETTLYAGGSFTESNSVTINYLSAFDGTDWTALGANDLDDEVNDITGGPGDSIYFAGSFSFFNGSVSRLG